MEKVQSREADETERKMKRELAKSIKDVGLEARTEYAEEMLQRETDDDSTDPTAEYNAIALHYVKKAADRFDGTVIRRSVKSVDNEGRRLISLADYKDIIAFVSLEEDELGAFDHAVSGLREG